MPAGIAVNISHAKINTQEKSASQNAEKKASVKEPEKNLKTDFKKLIDEKIEKKGEMPAGSSSEKKASVGIEKKASIEIGKKASALKSLSGGKLKKAGDEKNNPEKLSEKKTEQNDSEEMKDDKLISFSRDLKKETEDAAGKSAEKNISRVSLTAAVSGSQSSVSSVS